MATPVIFVIISSTTSLFVESLVATCLSIELVGGWLGEGCKRHNGVISRGSVYGGTFLGDGGQHEDQQRKA